MKKSTPIIKEIKDLFKAHGFKAERINAGQIPVGKGWMKLATPGHPDMIAYLPGPMTLFIEIKAEGDYLSEDQTDYITYLSRCGYVVLTAKNLEDVRVWLIAHGFVPASSAT